MWACESCLCILNSSTGATGARAKFSIFKFHSVESISAFFLSYTFYWSVTSICVYYFSHIFGCSFFSLFNSFYVIRFASFLVWINSNFLMFKIEHEDGDLKHCVDIEHQHAAEYDSPSFMMCEPFGSND